MPSISAGECRGRASSEFALPSTFVYANCIIFFNEFIFLVAIFFSNSISKKKNVDVGKVLIKIMA